MVTPSLARRPSLQSAHTRAVERGSAGYTKFHHSITGWTTPTRMHLPSGWKQWKKVCCFQWSYIKQQLLHGAWFFIDCNSGQSHCVLWEDCMTQYVVHHWTLETVTEDKSSLSPVTGLYIHGNRCDLSSNHAGSLGHCGSVISGVLSSVLSVYLRSQC